MSSPKSDFSEEHPPPDVLAKRFEMSGTTRQPPPVGLEHEMVLNEALNIFIERNGKRQDGWKEAGWKGNLVEMRKKLDRLWAAWDSPDKKDIDEALDLINAAVFYIRCVKEDNKNGNWPWPN